MWCVCAAFYFFGYRLIKKNDSVWRNTGHALRDRTERWNVLAVRRLPLAVTDALSRPSVASISRAQPLQRLLDT